jgi:antitoxin component YwqK of YwqJK toxin-antitoxin module
MSRAAWSKFAILSLLACGAALAAVLLGPGQSRAQDETPPPANPDLQVFESNWSDGTVMERAEGYLGPTGRRVKHGMYRFYHQNGKVREEMTFQHGKPVGEARFFHDNGTLAHQVTFQEGKRQGQAINYDEAGKKISVWQFKDDVPEGKWMWFYPDGNPLKLETFGSGYVSDIGEAIEPVEAREDEATLTAGIKQGEWKWWYPGGQIGIEGQYAGDAMDGTWTYYDRDGQVTETRQYKAGEQLNKPKYLPTADSQAATGETTAEPSATPIE